jgi:cell division protein FtsB
LELEETGNYSNSVGLNNLNITCNRGNYKQIISLVSPIIVRNDNPILLKMKLNENLKTFIATYSQNMFETYFTAGEVYFILKTQSGGYKCTCKADDTQNVAVTCPFSYAEGFEIYSYIMGKESIVNVTNTICQGNKVIYNDTCVDCKDKNENKPNFYNSKCYAKCPEGTYESNNQCVNSCPKYVQEGKCVDKCSNGYGLGSILQSECYLCKTKSQVYFDGYCRRSCPDEFTYDSETNSCFYRLKISTTISAEIVGFCKNNGTYYIQNNILKCSCPENYYGYQCSFTKEQSVVEANKLYTSIFGFGSIGEDGITQNIVPIDYNSEELLQDLSNLIDFLRTDSFDPDEELTEKIVDQAKHDVKTLLNEIANGNLNEIYKENFLAVITFAIEVSLSRARRRRLTEEQTNKLNEVVDVLKEFVAEVNQLKDSSSKIESNSFGLFNIHSYKNNDESKNDLYEKMNVSKNTAELAYLSVSDCEKEIPQDSTINLILSNDPRISLTAEQSLSINGVNENVVKSCKISYNYKTSCENDFDSEFNDNKYLTDNYANKGVDFNDPDDPFFNEICYTAPDTFDFDFSLKARFKDLYPSRIKIDFSDSESCKSQNSKCGEVLEITCDPSVTPSSILILSESNNNNRKTDYNLVTKCSKKVSNLSSNAGFILYMIFVILLLIGGTVYIVIDVLGLFEVSDVRKFQIDENISFTRADYIKDGQIEKKGEKELKVKTIRNKEAITNGVNTDSTEFLSFTNLLIKNIPRLHPITSNFYLSFINPIWLKLTFFISEILILFGFNSIFFKSGYIDTRMNEDSRNSFGYPLVKEFGRIILSIICCMCVTFVARLISFVTEGNITLLKQQSEDKNKFAEFNRNLLPRRIGSMLVLLGFVAFSWYYSTSFCYIYHNTQTGWIMGGIWSILFNWIIFAPAYIVLISYIETKNQFGAKIMKKLFLF